MFHTPIFPILPDFNKDNSLDRKNINRYLDYLKDKNVQTVMITSGTSRLNVLTKEENKLLIDLCLDHDFNVIGGLKPAGSKEIIDQIRLFKTNRLSFLLTYPERLYDHDSIYKYFKKIFDKTGSNILIHGLPIRKGTGGVTDFGYISPSTLSRLYNNGIILGMKEEYESMDMAFGNMIDLNTDFIFGKEFISIVSGGSMRRYWLLNLSGATTFLSGIGSVWPEIELYFYKTIKSDNFIEAIRIIDQYETPFFSSCFNRNGWHYNLKRALVFKGLHSGNSRDCEPKAIDDNDNLFSSIEQKLKNDKKIHTWTMRNRG